MLEKIIRKAAHGEANHDVGKAFCNAVIRSVLHEQGDPGKLRGGGGIRHVSIHGGNSDPTHVLQLPAAAVPFLSCKGGGDMRL